MNDEIEPAFVYTERGELQPDQECRYRAARKLQAHFYDEIRGEKNPIYMCFLQIYFLQKIVNKKLIAPGNYG